MLCRPLREIARSTNAQIACCSGRRTNSARISDDAALVTSERVERGGVSTARASSRL
jgi:hypothetical protein